MTYPTSPPAAPEMTDKELAHELRQNAETEEHINCCPMYASILRLAASRLEGAAREIEILRKDLQFEADHSSDEATRRNCEGALLREMQP